MTELWHEWLSDNKALILSGEQPIEFSQWLSIRLSESRQREADLARENAEWREGLKFVQLERDNRTSAYEIGVKLIGELQASNMRLREALNDLLGDCLESGDVPNQPFVKAPHHDSITDAERALAESPSASLEAIRAEAISTVIESLKGYPEAKGDPGIYKEVARLSLEAIEQTADVIRVEATKPYRKLCAEVYQIIGALDGPVNALDNLSDAANGDLLRHDCLLPYEPPDQSVIRAEAKAEEREATLDLICKLNPWIDRGAMLKAIRAHGDAGERG